MDDHTEKYETDVTPHCRCGGKKAVVTVKIVGVGPTGKVYSTATATCDQCGDARDDMNLEVVQA